MNSAMEVCVDASLALKVVFPVADSDKAANGRIAGIEILDARKRCGDPEVFRRVILEDIALAAPPASQHSLPRGETRDHVMIDNIK